MPIRETSRIVTISGRRWKITKFDALTGSFMATKLASKLSGAISGVISGRLDISKKEDQAVIAMSLIQEIGSLSKDEFFEISANALHVVSEVVEVKGQDQSQGKDIDNPVRLPDGRWGVADVENDPLLVMGLVSHALLFNLAGFFVEDALKDLGNSFKGLIPSNASI
jgi:hypothetical protein